MFLLLSYSIIRLQIRSSIGIMSWYKQNNYIAKVNVMFVQQIWKIKLTELWKLPQRNEGKQGEGKN